MKRREFLYLAGLSAVASTIPLAAQSSEDALESLSALVRARMESVHVPGVALGVLLNGQTSVRTFGVTSVDDPQPITPETIFPIASISKTFTATTIMRLIEREKMELNAPVQKYLTDFRVQDETVSRTVTVRHLLTHTPGWEGQVAAKDKGDDTLSVYAAGMKDFPKISDPGTVWSYNNAGFNLAGRVIEVVVGKNIHEALKEYIYTPLGLQRAFTKTGEAMTYRFALPHRTNNTTNQAEVMHNFELPADITAGAIATTVVDLLRYAQFHLGDGTVQGQHVLTRAFLDQMKTAQLTKNSTTDEMGIGWHMRRLNGVMTYAHGGTLSGHCLHIQLVPSHNLAFVILTNHANGWQLIQDVERAALKSYANLTLAPNQAIAHRGVSESMTAHAKPLDQQPPLEEYVGTYERPPAGKSTVTIASGKLMVGNNALTFYGPDIAYVTAGPSYAGTPCEFVRTPDGKVGWIRVQGRVAHKTA